MVTLAIRVAFLVRPGRKVRFPTSPTPARRHPPPQAQPLTPLTESSKRAQPLTSFCSTQLEGLLVEPQQVSHAPLRVRDDDAAAPEGVVPFQALRQPLLQIRIGRPDRAVGGGLLAVPRAAHAGPQVQEEPALRPGVQDVELEGGADMRGRLQTLGSDELRQLAEDAAAVGPVSTGVRGQGAELGGELVARPLQPRMAAARLLLGREAPAADAE
mmetsp:Transcript_68234/g.213430  ORF Transcript_68234/g.213430 Transcript_68234/m.213430 type:complete len:214 (+) Transcript_68234:132-773(+)